MCCAIGADTTCVHGLHGGVRLLYIIVNLSRWADLYPLGEVVCRGKDEAASTHLVTTTESVVRLLIHGKGVVVVVGAS